MCRVTGVVADAQGRATKALVVNAPCRDWLRLPGGCDGSGEAATAASPACPVQVISAAASQRAREAALASQDGGRRFWAAATLWSAGK
jgi:hypothetical protein